LIARLIKVKKKGGVLAKESGLGTTGHGRGLERDGWMDGYTKSGREPEAWLASRAGEGREIKLRYV
jgi:hypothetical protein